MLLLLRSEYLKISFQIPPQIAWRYTPIQFGELPIILLMTMHYFEQQA